jgi:glycosyltransferase involved in cell wall biosynthesis/2-polyprenyl-3-methyl-5-hydroxy-6-metoxy-1,4-benzoquinol methylase
MMQKFNGLETEKNNRCPVCHTPNETIFLTRADGVNTIECDRCQTIYVSEYPVELDRLYNQNYFNSSANLNSAGIGYQTGYTPIHEQLWQVGLTLIATDILKLPHDRVLDIGCATGQFLSLCRSFGVTELHGIELSTAAATIATQKGLEIGIGNITDYHPFQNHQITTAWDVIEHLPNPQLLISKVAACLNDTGIFCFSTPNGDVPRSIDDAKNWQGFQHSFEHIFYITQVGATKILDGTFRNIFLYPVQIYGGDLLLGICSKSSADWRQQELLNGLFANPSVLITAAANRELSEYGIAGLICLYMMFGNIADARSLIEILELQSSQLPLGVLPLLQGSVFARMGQVDRAQERYDLALNIFTTREIALSSYAALLQIYQQDKEPYIAKLEVQANTTRAGRKLAEKLNKNSVSSQNRRLTLEVNELTEKLRIQTEEFQNYKNDKELYVSALKGQSSIKVKVKSKLKFFLKKILTKLLPINIRSCWQNLSYESLSLQSNPFTTVYVKDREILTNYPHRVELNKVVRSNEPIAVTLITTVLNEETSVSDWLKSIAQQTRLPNELIVVDAGSTDRTRSIIEEFAKTASFKVSLTMNANVTIAQGRNLAIEMATHPIIASTDLGCHADPSWLELLIAPFEIDPATEVSAGWTQANTSNSFQESLAFLSTPSSYYQIDPTSYIPSSRTIAFVKTAWQQVGGYPEWATFAGEDSFFGLMLRNQCPNWAFVPEAIVYWQMRTTWKSVYKQAYLYGFGDGELGIYAQNYVRDLKYLVTVVLLIILCLPIGILVAIWSPFTGAILSAIGVILLILAVKKITGKFFRSVSGADRLSIPLTTLMLGTILIARVNGFINGVKHRPLTLQRLFANTIGTVIIFSGVPIDDSGGGQRATQLALELLDRGYRVVFLNQYPSYESLDLKLSIRHQNLETKSIDLFNPDLLIKSHDRQKLLMAIAEFPHPNFIKPMLSLRSYGAKTVYDLIDDWKSCLGGDWYNESLERELIDACDLLIASAQNLQTRLAANSEQEVLLVPNAVNQRIFKRESYPRPQDLIEGSPILMYIGALWGEWFDWELLVLIAKSYPQAQTIVIGDYQGQCPKNLPNLHFLGLKPQSSLPTYLAHADVTLIPFKISELTQAVNPLKVFEYLAMGVPVVSTSLNEVATMPYVYTGNSHQEFIEQIAVAISTPVDFQIIDRFIELNNWSQRVSSILTNIRASN